MKNNFFVVIPSLNPGKPFLRLLDSLCRDFDVLMVNDGSSRECRPLFDTAREKGCIVLTHDVNRGKGRALKTAFDYCIKNYPDIAGVVTADADGQHLPKDIAACGRRLEENPDSLIMGCRNFFRQGVPFPNKAGNLITSVFLAAMCGVKVSDTQTGLRGIPTRFMQILMEVDGDRFEFETNMLLATRTNHVPIKEIPIATVYEKQERVSHFRPVVDSLKIYGLMIKFMLSSVRGAVTDIVLFRILIYFIQPLSPGSYILISTALARAVSSMVNYLVNRYAVFKQDDGIYTIFRYYLLVVVQMLASALLVSGLFAILPLSETVIKIFVDVFLFFISFRIQNLWVFAKRGDKK